MFLFIGIKDHKPALGKRPCPLVEGSRSAERIIEKRDCTIALCLAETFRQGNNEDVRPDAVYSVPRLVSDISFP
jgi:hypothetical protein